MSPKQKADVVKMIQVAQPDKVTMAVGDGANDVNMISEAHVGVAISGVEGKQAVSASDYAFGEFRYLKKLILVHGREYYRRNCYLVNYSFYKNFVYVLPIFIFGFYTAFSA
mmetsp:Transcript_64251/g.88870  ORF Transcript_64251/g.88870 Transcript_64251/m.88870 type:complete len:111 (+) Transcript_64251:409-741(+)|eukprot:CAMPEP_0176404382 /NCGR_PEP_ID=MMETSP0126-20121128/50817_1 /TAXON_ID=141414 ORGANISM="Strombidinopsis acuminatum, Strain SPMC142" /NCGR_SAMPLE_ID=MMETSP0126 /ASSEMBLY_ACC=CAM_ASM_000229 /LENGTH=110 /DNA_ID=CAMNT_0017783133 /DNA_START=1025 /DNA_END=1357 /DNA_ORIENTATION=-